MLKLQKAKAQLVLDQPFFASLLFSLDLVENNSIETFATDGNCIKYNSAFCESMSQNEIVFVLAHEILHCIFEHPINLKDKEAMRWNVACDYVINEILVEDKVGTMPSGGLLDSDLVEKGKTAEGVYALLPKKLGKNQKPLDQLGEPKDSKGQTLDQSQKAKMIEDIKVKVTQAAQAAKSRGKLSQGLARLVESIVKTSTPWREILREFITQKTKTDFTYAKPKRRFMAEDFMLPSQTGEKLGRIVVAVDCSGSINQKTLDKFSAEINAIFEDTRPEEIEVIYFDSQVLKSQVFNEFPVKLEPIGGGGTAFSPVFELINQNEIVPACVVILTDLFCDDFGPCPDYPVLWASYGSNKADFGQVIQLEGN